MDLWNLWSGRALASDESSGCGVGGCDQNGVRGGGGGGSSGGVGGPGDGDGGDSCDRGDGGAGGGVGVCDFYCCHCQKWPLFFTIDMTVVFLYQ